MSSQPTTYSGTPVAHGLPSAVPDHSNRLYANMGLLLLAIVITAFGSRYFGRAFTDAPALPIFVHVHALLFMGWILLFTAQATLAQRSLFQYHRQLGIAGMGFAAIIIVVGMYSAAEGARRGHNPGGAPNALAFMIVGVTDIALFACFIAAAWTFRKQRELHKRFMLFATLGGFLFPAVTRLPFIPFGPQRILYMFAILLAVLLLPAITSLLTRRRTHWLDWIGAVTIFASLPLRRFVGTTESWQRFAAWVIS